jgi:hypothetical protein
MRKLVFDDLFSRQLGDLELHVPGIRAALTGLTYTLRTNPEFGTKLVDDPPFWFVPLPDVAQRALGVTYIFDDDQIRLLSIWIE